MNNLRQLGICRKKEVTLEHRGIRRAQEDLAHTKSRKKGSDPTASEISEEWGVDQIRYCFQGKNLTTKSRRDKIF